MNRRERLLCVLRGGIPDRMPFAPLINEYFLDSIKGEMKYKDPVDFLNFIEADVADRWARSYSGMDIFDESVLINGNTILNKMDRGREVSYEFITPVGALTKKIIRNDTAGSTFFISEHLIKSKEDIRTYKYLIESMHPYKTYDITKERIDYIGNSGIAMVTVPCTPIMSLIMYDLGLIETTYFLLDYKKEMNELIDIMTKKSIEAAKIAAKSSAEVGIIPENSGTMLVTPKMFKDYCKPLISEYSKIYKEEKKVLVLHACGHLNDLLSDIYETKIDAIDSLTSFPTGNVDYSQAREVFNDEITMMGGIDPIEFLNKTPKQLESKIIGLINKMQPGNRFILMPCDSTPANIPLENFIAVKETIEKYGTWHR